MHPPARDSDHLEELRVLASNGDQRAFEDLYRATVGAVYGLCLRMTANVALAEECTQQTYVQAWQHLGAFRAESAITTWLHRIAVNEVLGNGRRESRYRVVVEDYGVSNELLQTHPSSPDLDIEEAIAELPERQRQVFVLYAVYGYKHEETAALLDIAVGTSKAHYHKARRLLQSKLGGADEQSD